MNFNIDPQILHTWQLSDNVLCGEFPNTPLGNPKKMEALSNSFIHCIVDLTHPNDHLTSYKRYIRPYMSYHSFPIEDGGVNDLQFYIGATAILKAHLDIGDNIYIHCQGGVGRTATLAACLLGVIEPDITPQLALLRINKAREGTTKCDRPAPENDFQIKAVLDFYNAKVNLAL